MPGTRFFKNIPDKNISRAVSGPIEVRGDVFRVLAVAIMDNLKSGVSLPDATLKKVLDRFAVLFPESKKNQTHLPLDPETLGCLAVVLRQLAIDEMLANPCAYQEFFAGINKGLTQDSLRQMEIPLHSCVVAAVAKVLNITITLSLKTPEEELRARRVLNKANCSSQFNITLQVQDEIYLPCVRNQTYFAAIGQLPVNRLKPVMPHSSGTIGEVLVEISHSNEALWQKYQEYRTRLISTANANELTFRQLALLYTENAFLPDESSIRLFATLEKQRDNPIVRGPRDNLEQSRRKMLIDAFASGLSTGTINEDDLFDAMEPSYSRALKVGNPM